MALLTPRAKPFFPRLGHKSLVQLAITCMEALQGPTGEKLGDVLDLLDFRYGIFCFFMIFYWLKMAGRLADVFPNSFRPFWNFSNSDHIWSPRPLYDHNTFKIQETSQIMFRILLFRISTFWKSQFFKNLEGVAQQRVG